MIYFILLTQTELSARIDEQPNSAFSSCIYIPRLNYEFSSLQIKWISKFQTLTFQNAVLNLWTDYYCNFTEKAIIRSRGLFIYVGHNFISASLWCHVHYYFSLLI
ncbi:hypothetical protein C0J52_16727 [Blattella germanica]|nr:hypothetical protein C0J52_16727 [Blattella germanica]